MQDGLNSMKNCFDWEHLAEMYATTAMEITVPGVDYSDAQYLQEALVEIEKNPSKASHISRHMLSIRTPDEWIKRFLFGMQGESKAIRDMERMLGVEQPRNAKAHQVVDEGTKLVETLRKRRGDVSKPTAVFLIGYPGCGKSTLAKRLGTELDAEVVNMDTLGTERACIAATTRAIGAKRNIVLDNTNMTRKVRDVYHALFKGTGYTQVAVNVDAPLRLCFHLNWMRVARGERGSKVPTVAYYKMRKDYQEPTKEEGFDDVLKYEVKIVEPPPEYWYWYDID